VDITSLNISHKLKIRFFISFCLILLLFPSLSTSASSHLKKATLNDPSAVESKTASRVIEEDTILIDGKLDENSWENTSVLTGFIQNNPDEGAPATEKTEVRILYSNESLYIGVRALDSEADKIKAILARRDSKCPSDWLKIWIDSYHDLRTAFEFSVNPCGVKRDVFWSNDRRQDDDWDAIWDVEVTQDEQGWTAEFRIPFSQIRFPERESHTWGFQAGRVIARKNETSYWRHVPKGVPQFVSLFGDIKGISGIPSPKRLQLLPYIVGKSAFQSAEEGNPFKTGSKYLSNLGLDIKYGVSSNLTLDATINPDFGQVEADPADVNLTAYETYFEEKRPFFIEGRNMLSFPLGSGRERDTLFYSRRVGRRPHGSPSSVEYYQKPENTTILGAFKLTGKTTSGWSIGIMEALTGQELAKVITETGERTEQTVEPFSNYFLGRVEKEFRNGRSAIGFILTAVNRNIQNDNLEFLRKAAYSGGLSFRHRWAQDTYEVSGYFLESHIRGTEEAILNAQESSARYFQRPDATHLELDPTRTSLSGFSSSFTLAKIGGGHWRWSTGIRASSPGFEINDMGYLRDVDEIRPYIWLSYNEYKPGKIFRDYDINLTLWNTYDFSWTNLGLGGSLRADLKFLNYWSINLNLSRTEERLSTSHLRGGPAVLIPGNWRVGGSFRTDTRNRFHLNLRGSITSSDHGALTHSLSSGFTIRPSDRIHLSVSPNFNKSSRYLQYMSKETSDAQAHYILSRIDQTTISLTLRLNYTLTPTLSLQLYSQPYVSAGQYSEFKEVIDPRAKNYLDRWHIFSGQELVLKGDYYYLYPAGDLGEEFIFSDPDFNFRQFRLNLVIRWEYLPGSTLFLVWTNGINDRTDFGSLSIGDDLKGLFSSPSNNAFLLKISYWFNL